MKNLPLFLLLSLSAAAQKPLLFDHIRYVVSDRTAVNSFFKTNFGAKALKEQPMNPVTFIDILEIRNGQVTLNSSGPGPFTGLGGNDPKSGSREVVKAKVNQYVYGMHWLALSTRSLESTLKTLAMRRVPIAAIPAKLPFEPSARSIAVYGPDMSLVLLVERPSDPGPTPFGVDHIQLICEDVAANEKFYTEVLGAQVLARKGKSVKLQVAQHVLVLSEPEDLGLPRTQVQKKDRTKFFPGPDGFGFLYDEPGLKVATDSTVAKGYAMPTPPARMTFQDKPTPYTSATLYSPDQFGIELQTEDNRTGPRK